MTQGNQPDQDKPISYEVGYGKPPAHSRFKPGQSGNPKGKKKGTKGLRSVVSRVLNEKVHIRTPRGSKKITKQEALVQSMMARALKGDAKAAEAVLRLARDAGLINEVADALNAQTMKALSEEDRAILQRFKIDNRNATSGDPK
ncbi:hypothetical protein CSC94_23305 [Zhengella mangrovi]|uniref:DUF5681 domain-containing protein n=1 Tax=Zhengella mangrovi TaxID=1982044 RepID=A0A2G1QGP2_9HYPH|nr:DUF5681 domain-containing protein [Zhengella mangrovi]PHP64630.1 hypothetical protein CSC94_23305 [Zhengella mangrovi]